MDTSRIAVVFWISFPLIVYAIVRLVRWGLLWKYPAITSGRITEVYTYVKTNPDGSKTNESYIGYTFNVEGTDYTDDDKPIWGRYTPGDVIKVRYDPHMPGDSMIWRPGKTQEWIMVSLIWLAWVLGTTFFLILLGLYSALGVGWFIKNILPFSKLGLVGKFMLALVSIFVLFFAFLWIEMGVDVFRNCGFVGQIWLWTMWNHQAQCFLP